MLETLRRPAMRVFTLFLILVGLLPVGSLAAQATTSTYSSATFGYTVNWTDDWEINAEFSMQQASMLDLITLFSTDGRSFVMITGFDAVTIDPITMIEPDPEEEVLDLDLEATVPSSLIRDDRSLQRSEVYTLNDGETGLMVLVWGPEQGFDDLITHVQDTVLVNGKMIMTGKNLESSSSGRTSTTSTSEGTVTRTKRGSHTTESTEVATETPIATETTRGSRTSRTASADTTPEATEVAAGEIESYTGTVFGYTVEYDTNLWTMDGVFEADDLDGIRLYGDSSTLTIWAWSGYGADAPACLQGESDFYSTEVDAISDWETAINANGDALWYESADLSWGVFNLNYEGTALVDYISCQPIPGQDAVLITLLSSNPAEYNASLDATLDILDAVTFGEATPENTSTPVATEVAVTTNSTTTTTTGNRADVSTAIDGTTYESPNYGYSVEIPLEWTVVSEDSTTGDERLVLSNGTSTVTLWGTDAAVGDLAGCVDYAAGQSGLDLTIDTDADGAEFRGVYGKQSFGNFVYDNAGTKMMYFIGCEPIPGTESHLIVIQDVPYDQFTSQRRYRSQLEGSIVFP